MKFIYFVFCMLFSQYIHATPNNDFKLGIELFELGKFDEAISILEPLAKSENSMANYYLGLIHDPEFNRPPFSKEFIKYDKENENKTRKYYRKASELGNAYATYQLGKYYKSMLSRRQQYKRSDRLLKAARQELERLSINGDWLSKYMLAVISGNSPSTKLKAKEAIRAIEKEAIIGDRKAQLYFGRALSQWLCRTDECKDYPTAFAWFVVSASQGSYHAKYHLMNLMKIMDKEELELGKKLAADYLTKYQKQKYNQSINVDSVKETTLELH